MDSIEAAVMDIIPSSNATVEPAVFRLCSPTTIYSVAGACLLIAVCTVPLNVVTMLALIKHKLKEAPASLFIFSITLSDLVLGGFHASLTSLSLLRVFKSLHPIVVTALAYSQYSMFMVAMLSMTAISISRLMLFTDGVLFHRIFNFKNCVLMMAGIWLASIAVLFPTLFGVFGQFGTDPITGFYTVVTDSRGRSPRSFFHMLTFLAAYFTMNFSYGSVYKKVKSSSDRMGTNENNKTCPKQSAVISTPRANLTLACETPPSTTSTNESLVAPTAPVTPGALVVPTILITPPIPDIIITPAEPIIPVIIITTADVEAPIIQATLDVPAPIQLITPALPTAVTGPIVPAAPAEHDNQSGEGTLTSFSSLTSSIRKLISSVRRRCHMTPRERQLLMMIVAMLLTMVLCYLPLALVEMYEEQVGPTVVLWAHVMLYVASCANPAVYMLLSNEYRDSYTVLFYGRAALARRRYL